MPRHVVVLGGGATGEAFMGALRRLDKDIRMTLVEDELVGGECSYWACIPSKTLLRPVEVAFRARLAPGVSATIDPVQIFKWRDEVAEKDDTSQVAWVERLDAEVVKGSARIEAPGRIDVDGRTLEYDELMVSTGSVPAVPPIEGIAEAGVWTSREATSASAVPESLLIVGAGAVGCELAQFYARAGSKVTLIQSGDFILPRVDREAGDLLAEFFGEEGIDIRLNARAQRVEPVDGGLRLELGGETLEASNLLVATGRRPNIEGLGLENVDVEVGREGIQVDDRLCAGDHVWAAGDVTGIALFTHVGKYQGRVAAANVAGRERHADYRALPSAIFTDPQVAAVGHTEKTAREAGLDFHILEVGTSSNAGGSYYGRNAPGTSRLLVDKESDLIVGATITGADVADFLHAATIAVVGEVPLERLRHAVPAFPTRSEIWLQLTA
jgi:pyruvate/2-oxoglutarate dehydrogenase complex dihydrolipoamide dehydrogenase (E3) component